MIEINLLPQEYRVQEKTPLGLFLAIIVGICVNGAIFTYQLSLKNDLAKAQQRNAQLVQEKERTDQEVAKVKKLEQEIGIAKRRQETIIEISQSKIVWSQKLIQLGRIMAEYPNFWIDRLNLSRGGTGGQLTCNFYAVGNDLRTVAAFRERLTSDTNFWYHFDKFNAPRVTVTPTGGGPLARYGYTGPIMYFDVQIPVK
jgi:Tfp pilus assembly protein PilN